MFQIVVFGGVVIMVVVAVCKSSRLVELRYRITKRDRYLTKKKNSHFPIIQLHFSEPYLIH